MSLRKRGTRVIACWTIPTAFPRLKKTGVLVTHIHCTITFSFKLHYFLHSFSFFIKKFYECQLSFFYFIISLRNLFLHKKLFNSKKILTAVLKASRQFLTSINSEFSTVRFIFNSCIFLLNIRFYLQYTMT